MFKRPTQNETEDDILRLQREFLANKNLPAAKCVKKDVKNADSKRDVIRLDEGYKEKEKKNIRFNIEEKDFLSSKPTHGSNSGDSIEVFSDIKERDLLAFQDHNQFREFVKGFPSAPKLHKSKGLHSANKKKQSLFAQQFSSFSVKDDFGAKNENLVEKNGKNIVENSNSNNSQIGYKEDRSCLTARSKTSVNEEINHENLKKLSQMTESEILEEQQNLLKSLDPNTILFLKNSKYKREIDETEKSKLQGSASVNKQKEEKEEVKNSNGHQQDNFDPQKYFQIDVNLPHMGVVETEKLEWMKDLPKITTNKDSKMPRFDCSGNVLNEDDDIALHKGLHHHADEPSLPGYTLEELFTMIRSKVAKQRVFGLEVMAKIIEAYYLQRYTGLFTEDLLIQCMAAGLVFLLRWSLDDEAEQINSAALQVLANILYNRKEQDLLSRYFFAYDGEKIPSLCVTTLKKKKSEMTQEELEEDRDYTDAEMVQLDLIKGLLQMQILGRLHYLIGVFKTSDNAICNCLKILIRICQHSSESSLAVLKDEKLLPTIMALLAKVNYEMKRYLFILISLLCRQTETNIINDMVDQYGLEELAISTFVSSMVDSHDRDYSLLSSVVQLWVVLLRNGISSSSIKNIHPYCIEQLHKMATNLSNINDLQGGCILRIVEAAMLASRTFQDNQCWSAVNDFYNIIYIITKATIKNLYESKQVKHPLTTTLLVRCCSAYFKSKNYQTRCVAPAKLLDDVNSFWKEFVQPFILSDLFVQLTGDLGVFTIFANAASSRGSYNRMACLPTYGFDEIKDREMLTFENGCPIMLLQAVFHMLVQLLKINKSLVNKVAVVISSPTLLMYLRAGLDSPHINFCFRPLLAMNERWIVSDVIYLFCLMMEQDITSIAPSVKKIYLEFTFKMLPTYSLMFERRVIMAMKNICFGKVLYKDLTYVIQGIDTGTSASLQNLLSRIHKNLPLIEKTYSKILFGEERKTVSKKSSCEVFMNIGMTAATLPSDWMFYPLIKMQSSSMNLEQRGELIMKGKKETIEAIYQCLQFILMLEVTFPDALREISETIRLSRLYCLFLTEGSVYAESYIKEVVDLLIFVYTSPNFVNYLCFEETIPGVTSFYDMYCSVVEHYLASSFNDYTFANVVLIPLQLKHDIKYRKAVWTDYKDILRVFPLPIKLVMGNIGSYLAESSENINMIQIYFKAALSGSLKLTWCPFFYLVAVHHISQFLFSTNSDNGVKEEDAKLSNMRNKMMVTLLKLSDKDLMDDIIYYEAPDIASAKGFKKFIHLPPSREVLLRQRNDTND